MMVTPTHALELRAGVEGQLYVIPEGEKICFRPVNAD